MRTYGVDVIRSGRWWAIEVPEVKGAHSQARRLGEVEEMARDVIALMLEVPADSFAVDVRIQMPSDVRWELDESMRLRHEAARRQSEAAKHARRAARRLHDQHWSYREISKVLGVSYQRVKQLVDEAEDLVDA